ncbi:MAG: radical SAM protein [Fusobacteriales bacterium]|jgi:uncharacterized radical SAM superfamily Fe-S cluster-containing enzyme|nr:radical SAM protein [Fusobacteriales bacterium]
MENNIIATTKSLCPVCLKKISADYTAEDGKVYLFKECDLHGSFKTLVWDNEGHFRQFYKPDSNKDKPLNTKKIKAGCPFDCGICESHRQATCCVLLEVTDRCNLNCPVCFSKAGSGISSDPSLEKISEWYEMLLESGGPFNIQLSGGEPTLRHDLDEIIKLGKNKGFDFFQLNTNGIRIGEDMTYLKKLADSGLNTVFLQFDGFSDSTFEYLRGKNILDKKLQAIENCKKLNIGVVLVPTVKKGINDKEIGDIINFAADNIPHIRSVHFQPMSFFGRYEKAPDNEDRMTIYKILEEIEKQTNGKMKIKDFESGSAEHSLCSFHGDFFKENDEIRPVKLKSNSCCSSQSARKSVAGKWSMMKFESSSVKEKNGFNLQSIDSFLDKINNNKISISGMAFQDVWNLDIDRLQKCYIHTVSQNSGLIPFCAYNLTSLSGKSLYRKAFKQQG